MNEMNEKVKELLADEFAYLITGAAGSGAGDRADEVVQIYARIFNTDMAAAHRELLRKTSALD